MTKPTKSLYVRNRKEWRAWLAKHGGTEQEIWLVYPKKNCADVRIPYDDAVEEALCFGWIDGTVKRLDEDRYLQRFTPRKKGSRWSESNITRVQALIKKRRMTKSGLAVFTPERKVEAHPTEMLPALKKRLQSNKTAWANFQKFPPYYRRGTIAWVSSAKKEDTQLRRLQQLIEPSAKNQRIKFM